MGRYSVRYTIVGSTSGEVTVAATSSDNACHRAARRLDAKYGTGNWCIRAVDAL
ncbi:hypothetical protein L5G28_07680 [Gordonia sp. HY285]|uniref:hypothetical protein n=1 Tax=Gordonia liuliyuniae TaxID=2911517 RepID=UPI001F182C9C|nr:hypothetical protein [Gordonia liuliyuniae]MCF8610041.1 hypothetical protein [Gordonia liuliyuniae]